MAKHKGKGVAKANHQKHTAAQRLGTLKSGRPPTAKQPPPSQSSELTRKKIRAYHMLNKQLTAAEAKGDEAGADELRKRIDDLGGLKAYQLASVQGQANDRGGDSSAVLMQWLKPTAADVAKREDKLRLLEVGALSTTNVCSKSGLFDIQRIDLFSQTEGIVQQDFMERPVPSDDSNKFDIISLSLVLNFVPDAESRGQMLKRTRQFLGTESLRASSDALRAIFPALFLVLPAPCISNSRYMNEERLTCMMGSLGYVLLERKQTAKLIYLLWQLRDKPSTEVFSKKLVNDGPGKNNFCVVLR